MNQKISLYCPPLQGMTDYTQLIDLAAARGISAVETLNMFELTTPDLDAAKALRRYADEKGVRFSCVSLGINLVEEDSWNWIAIVRQYAEVAAILGSPFLHHTIALEFSDYEKVRCNWDTYYQRGLRAVRLIADYAQNFGLKCLYEDQGYLFNGVEGMSRFLQDVDRDIGLVADFGNIQFVDEAIEDFIPHFPGKFYHAHVKDYLRCSPTPAQLQSGTAQLSRGGTLLTDCAFGQGCVHFAAGWEALKATGFDGYVSFECPPLPGWKDAQLFDSNLQFINELMK